MRQYVASGTMPLREGRRHLVRLGRRDVLGCLGAGFMLVLVLLALLAEHLAPYSADRTQARDRLTPPSLTYLLGTDNLGRDICSRLIYGARLALLVGLGAMLVDLLLGTTIGVVSGYAGGVWDLLLQRAIDAWMACPWFLLAVSTMGLLGPGLLHLTLTLGLLRAPATARLMRSVTLRLAAQPYIEAARAVGASHGRLLWRHIGPHLLGPVLITATVALGTMILAESALSFLGYGVPPPSPSWGQMLNGSGRVFMLRAPWMALAPGLAVSLTVLSCHLVGDGLRDRLDPHLRGMA